MSTNCPNRPPATVRAFWFACIVLAGLPLAAQAVTGDGLGEAARATTAEFSSLKLMVFPARSIDELSGGADTNPSLNASLSTILASRARQSDFTLVPAPDWQSIASQQAVDGDQSDLVLAAGKQAAVHATLSLFWFQEGRRITLIAKIYDVWQQRLVAGATLTGLDDLSLLNTTDTLLAGLLDKLVAEAPAIIADYGAGGPGTMSRELVIRSRAEGARVSLVGGEVLGTITNGQLNLPFRPLAVNNAIELLLDKPGFYPKTVKTRIKDTKPELNLPSLYPKTSFTILVSVDPDMLIPVGLGSSPESNSSSTSQPSTRLKVGANLGFRWFPVPDTWFVQANYQFNMLNSKNSQLDQTVTPFIMHQASLITAVAVLTPADWVVRVFAGLGIGAYISTGSANQSPVFLDPYLELPALIAQINLHPVAIEIGAGAIFVFDSTANLLPAGLVKSLGLTRFSLGWKL